MALLERPHRATTPPPRDAGPVIAFEHVAIAFDDQVVLRDVTFDVQPGAMAILIGASGSGKSLILRLALGLVKPDAGAIRIDGTRIDELSERDLIGVRSRIGMLFQESALFDSLTVADNVGYRLYEETAIPPDQVRARVEYVLDVVGLAGYGDRSTAELSGGQRRRVAIARAMAAWPHVILWDDPTSGLDPITAHTIQNEMIHLRDVDHVTSMVATHQLPDAFYMATHGALPGPAAAVIPVASPRAVFLVIRDGRVYFHGTVDDLRASRDPFIRSFLTGWVPPLVEE